MSNEDVSTIDFEALNAAVDRTNNLFVSRFRVSARTKLETENGDGFIAFRKLGGWCLCWEPDGASVVNIRSAPAEVRVNACRVLPALWDALIEVETAHKNSMQEAASLYDDFVRSKA